MEKRTIGTIISAKKQWWLKVNTKALRTGPQDGATFPYIVQVKYKVNGTEYVKRKWVSAGSPVPSEGDIVQLVYEDDRPDSVTIEY